MVYLTCVLETDDASIPLSSLGVGVLVCCASVWGAHYFHERSLSFNFNFACLAAFLSSST